MAKEKFNDENHFSMEFNYKTLTISSVKRINFINRIRTTIQKNYFGNNSFLP